MARMVDNINVPMARASILWLIGEYSPSLLDIISFIYCLLQTSTHKDIIIHMARMVDNINVPMARASILWLIGEYSPSLLDIISFIYCLLQTSTHKGIIIHMARMARASILWLIGEYSPSLLDIINIALFIVSSRPPHTRRSLFIWLGWLITSMCPWLEQVFCG